MKEENKKKAIKKTLVKHMDPAYGDVNPFLPKNKKMEKIKRISPEQYKKDRKERIMREMKDNFGL